MQLIPSSRSILAGLSLLPLLLAGIAAPPTRAQAPGGLDRGPGLQVDGSRYNQNVIYRPPTADFRMWDGKRFDLIYQEGARSEARYMKEALRSAWPRVDSLVGPVASGFETPVVVRAYSDAGTGRVRAFPFYQEMSTVSLKTPFVSRYSTWAASVAPHELVHSAHLEVNAGVGLGGLVRPFAPDWARGVNGLYPFGIGEGAAVYLESQLEENAGRLHSPLFTMKVKAAMLSDDPWSLSQMLNVAVYTRPANRHYVGGAHVFDHLATRGDTTSAEFFHEAVRGQNRFPVLGLGAWLGVGAGQFPSQLGDEIRTQLQEEYSAELDRRRPFTDVTVVSSDKGLYNRRPYWLTDSTLVAYANGYDVRQGLYKIDAQTGERTLIRPQTLPNSRRYTLGRDTTALLTARYVTDPLVPSQQSAEIERVDLSSGAATPLTEDGGAGAPVEGPSGQVHAAKNDGQFTQWGMVDGDSVRALTSTATTIRRIAPAPQAGGPIAVLKTVSGEQQIYRAEWSEGGPPEMDPWIRIDDAVIYDLTWGPEGRYLLFTADYPQAPGIFAFDRRTEKMLHLAKRPFAAREPALSPDRSTLAFASYQDERYNLVKTAFRPDSADVVPESDWTLGGTAPEPPAAPEAPVSNSESRPYSAWRHLGPDAVYPTLRDSPTEWGQYVGPDAEPLAIGLEMSGADPLRRVGYRSALYWEDGRIWGEARIESAQFLLRPSLSAYNRAVTPSGGSASGLEERGVGLGLRLPITLQSNVYQSSVQFGLETQLRQTRQYGGGLDGLTPFSTRLTLEPRFGLRYRVQKNRRDILPNTGLVIGAEGSYDAWTEEMRSGLDGRHKALRSNVSLYLPFLRGSNTGLRLGANVLTQNRSSFDAELFAPRGYDTLPGGPDGTFLRFDAEVVQPLWYIDDGLTVLPVYLGALSAYGFGQTIGPVDGGWQDARTSVGAGLGLSVNLFYQFNLKLRAGAAYRVGPGNVTATFR